MDLALLRKRKVPPAIRVSRHEAGEGAHRQERIKKTELCNDYGLILWFFRILLVFVVVLERKRSKAEDDDENENENEDDRPSVP